MCCFVSEDKPKSQLEILAEMRDYKRRRQSYRAKNVHITKKSYTEVCILCFWYSKNILFLALLYLNNDNNNFISGYERSYRKPNKLPDGNRKI